MKFVFNDTMPPVPIPLSDLPVGASARVVAIDAAPALVERLEALGFLPATEVACRRRAPLGDPRVYELRGTQLCLRRSEAARIKVEPR
jgi:ferrous iron transport protein A